MLLLMDKNIALLEVASTNLDLLENKEIVEGDIINYNERKYEVIDMLNNEILIAPVDKMEHLYKKDIVRINGDKFPYTIIST